MWSNFLALEVFNQRWYIWVYRFFFTLTEFCPLLFVYFKVTLSVISSKAVVVEASSLFVLLNKLLVPAQWRQTGYDYWLEVAILIWCYLMFSEDSTTCGEEMWAIINIRRVFFFNSPFMDFAIPLDL